MRQVDKRLHVVLAVLAVTLVVTATVKAAVKNVVQPGTQTIAWAQHGFVRNENPRTLIVGHYVPPGETWELSSMHAKNNSGRTGEINAAVFSAAINEWVCLAGGANLEQYEGVAWSGSLLLDYGDGIGWWFRDAEPGDILQVDATWTRRLVTDEARSLVAPGSWVTVDEGYDLRPLQDGP